MGKNREKTGSKIVPRPNPEKKVRIEAKKATKQIIIYSIGINVRIFITA
jgi:hypothetical protein